MVENVMVMEKVSGFHLSQLYLLVPPRTNRSKDLMQKETFIQQVFIKAKLDQQFLQAHMCYLTPILSLYFSLGLNERAMSQIFN